MHYIGGNICLLLNLMVSGGFMNEVIGKTMSILYRYRQIIINHKLRPYGLGSGQHIFLINIARHEGINQKDLTNLVKFDKATTAKALKKLEENGYIYRQCDEGDRRYNQLFLTEKGGEMMPVIMSTLVEITDDLIQGLTEEEQDHFSRCLETMLNNAITAVDQLRNEK